MQLLVKRVQGRKGEIFGPIAIGFINEGCMLTTGTEPVFGWLTGSLYSETPTGNDIDASMGCPIVPLIG